ncbi:MAG: hypothetical protein OWS03_02120 [Alicyclobacillaceae bacterium]|nr:hypothetical protein [Alicyclobacillaceae bacterium]
MGIGFVVTIVLLAIVLGIFSKQALKTPDNKSSHFTAADSSTVFIEETDEESDENRTPAI